MNNEDTIRDFIIRTTSGDSTVEVYDQWCKVSELMAYDHYNANLFLLSALENFDSKTTLDRILGGFASAARMQAENIGISLNSDLNHQQLISWVTAMSSISEQDDYSDIKDILYSDLDDKIKVQQIFQLLGPGDSIEYEDMIYSVEVGFINKLKASVEKSSQMQAPQEVDPSVQEKIKDYGLFKKLITGNVFSDMFACTPGSFGMDIDVYLTAMKQNADFYDQQENWEDFFIDVYGSLILSNTKKQDYNKFMEAAVYEFYDNDTIRAKVLVEMKKALLRFQS